MNCVGGRRERESGDVVLYGRNREEEKRLRRRSGRGLAAQRGRRCSHGRSSSICPPPVLPLPLARSHPPCEDTEPSQPELVLAGAGGEGMDVDEFRSGGILCEGGDLDGVLPVATVLEPLLAPGE